MSFAKLFLLSVERMAKMAVAIVITAATLQEAISIGIKSYSAATYNELPDFYVTSHNGISRDQEIKSLGQIFIDHNVYQDFGLSLLHKVIL